MIEDTRKAAENSSGRYFLDLALFSAEESLADFSSREWPFSSGEGAITTIAPYTTGTLSFVNGSQNVVGVGTTWNTAWPQNAILRAGGANGEAFLVTAFNSTTGLTIDRPFPFASIGTQTYTLEFPSYPISECIRVEMVCAAQAWWVAPLQITSIEEILYDRSYLNPFQFPVKFFVAPGDGTTSAALIMSPSPATVQTIRFRYTNAVPTFRCLVGSNDAAQDGGLATLGAGGTALTGSNTSWLKLGYSLAGQYFEQADQDGIYSLISAVPTDTSATVGAWGGRAVSAASYYISPKILIPDDFRPMLRDLMRWKYFQNAKEPDLAALAYERYNRNYSLAMTRMNRMRGPGTVNPISLGEDGERMDPGIPWQLTVSYVP